MKQQKRKIEIAIVILVILVIICILLIYGLKKGDSVVEQNNNQLEGDDLTIEYTVERLKDPVKFFSVEKCIQKNIDESFKAKDMTLLEGERIYSFAVYGTDENQKDTYFIVRVDMENSTFRIEELHNSVDDIKQIDLATNLKQIQENEKNAFEFINMRDEDTCRMYLRHFTQMELENPKEAYSKIEEEYRKERFPTFDEYQEYIEKCKQIIEEGILAKYLVNYHDDYVEYILVDNYDNYYTFKASAVLDYTVMLDNYTIKLENYEENYKKLTNEKKVQANVYLFLKMINTKDDRHAYELLNEVFKSNNFATLEEFKEFIQNNFFSYNLDTQEANIREEGNYYIYETTIKESSSSAAESKKLTVIMQLKEGTDFVMSFNIE